MVAKKKHSKQKPPDPPGYKLEKEFLKPLGISRTEFAKRCKLAPKTIREVCEGNRPINARISIRLANVLGMPLEYWIFLQSDFDLWHAKQWFKRYKQAKLKKSN